MHFKGDTGKFRKALAHAGFKGHAEDMIFNDDRHGTPKPPGRRLKLWFADGIAVAPLDKQWKLEEALRKEFGNRIVSMHFIAHWRGGKSLVIRLNT